MGEKITHVRAHIRRTRKKRKSEKNVSPIQRIVNAEADNIAKGKRRKIEL